ncbi:MAG TPA: AMP-binding protein [Candidatus Acidoferrales bacterium]|nr:AMP-binding protein [Candidatus Acidoferrales bacterium]
MPQWNLADCLDRIAAIRADEEAVIQGKRTLSWKNLERRARNLAAWMIERGATHQGKVALYTYNHPAYMEAVYAAFKAALVPVNVNYRYREEELRYLLDNADAEIVVVHEDFVPLLTKVVGQLPHIKGVLVVTEGGKEALPKGAAAYEKTAEDDRQEPKAVRSGDDMMFLYTGGTTGMPKGVMWRQDDLYYRFAAGGLGQPPASLGELEEYVRNVPMQLRTLIGPPLMHGTGWFTAMIAWLSGGTVILLDDPKSFQAEQLWQSVSRTKATAVTIVGDSFARPMLRALESAATPFDLSSLNMIASSGVMWSQETKQALLKFLPHVMLVDAFSSSEAVGMGLSITTAAGAVSTAKFQLTDKTRLFDENLRLLDTKPGMKGLVGVGGNQPVGYYKDPDKSARTFVSTEHGRFSIPGDWAVVNDDGVTLTLLGRGSVCINTGGEKVFPEEVEEVVKRFGGVKDAVVVGVPDDKWGEAITAVVSSSGTTIDTEALKAFVKEHLAGYKAPKHVVVVDEVYRSPSGKADFKRTKQVALETLGL